MNSRPLIQEFDAVVIGAGINGSSAALHLAKCGRKTALIEQFPIPHNRGSSGGQTRIFRFANSCSHDFLTPLLKDSLRQWKEIERLSGCDLLRPCKMFTISEDPNGKEIELIRKSVEKVEGNSTWTEGRDFNDEFSTNFPNSSRVIVDNQSAVMMAEKCLSALQKILVDLGGTIIDEHPVETISVQNNGLISVSGPKGVVRTRQLVICAGPWSSSLFEPLGISLPLRPEKIGVYYWSIKERKSDPFIFIYVKEGEPYIYGLPSLEYPGLMKIGLHAGNKADPDARDKEPNLEDEKAVSQFIKSHLPWIDPQPAIQESCMYTITPDEEMIIDYHPVHKNIVYACGFSGTGFKTAPTVGRILCDMVQGRNPPFIIDRYSSKRFQKMKLQSNL